MDLMHFMVREPVCVVCHLNRKASQHILSGIVLAPFNGWDDFLRTGAVKAEPLAER
jgi:hypothetical protein